MKETSAEKISVKPKANIREEIMMNAIRRSGLNRESSVNNHILVFVMMITGIFLFSAHSVLSQGTIGFTSSGLKGATINNPTSLQFGPDQRLYVSQQNGLIFAFTVLRDGPGNYRAESAETITLIKSIPNHDDNGQLNASVKDRQITGILLSGSAENPVIYVTSSDPRIGGGGTGGDKNLDTNSGMLSRLDRINGKWERTDIVLGLPRSEENHAVNGMQLDEAADVLYLAVGGHTNAGAPSNNFAFLTEYALSAAILSIELGRIKNEFGGSYVLPTLDDPDRANQPDGTDVNDPFGGNDGRNQAKIVPGGPVRIHSPGYRNAYDLVLTRTPGKAGRLYTIDNGANGGWGGHPDHEGAFGDPLTTGVTNNYVVGEPGSSGPGPNDAKVNNKDHLHLVSAPGMTPVYGGHPVPVRANPLGAGLYWYDNVQAKAFYDLKPTADWPPVPVQMADPVQGDFRNPGVNDGALYTWTSSTNGLCEYTSSAFFSGALTGDLLAAAFDGTIYRIKLSDDGKSVRFVEPLASGFGTTPLDVTAQGPDQIFEGTVWAVTYGTDAVTVFEPEGTWEALAFADGTGPVARSDNGFAEVNGKFFLLGGRETSKVDIYDPVTKKWSAGGGMPFDMHHFQPVVWQDKIYVAGAFRDGDAGATAVPVTDVYIYDPVSMEWSKGPAIPRPRGAAGAVAYDDRIYVFGGLTNGHVNGWVGWVDQFDPAAGEWTVLPDMPRERDHFQAALVEGRIVLAGGRKTNVAGDLFGTTIPEVDVFDPVTSAWSTLPASANVPTQRAGASVAVLNSELFLLGGESPAQTAAFQTVQVFDIRNQTWRSSARMITGREGTGAVTFQGAIYVAAGSSVRGSATPLATMEKLQTLTRCTGDPNSLQTDDDGDGFSNGDETQNGTNLCSASSVPPDMDGDYVSDLLDSDDDGDGLPDTSDPFAADAANGLSVGLPIDYPMLNGDPGWGLFGMGFTGLMTNGKDNYQSLYDNDNPDLIMGGAVGIANIPAGAGNTLNNAQTCAFQTGFRISPADEKITMKVLLQGPYFNSGTLADQQHGFFFGKGDQDNYVAFVLAANNGAPGFRIFGETAGTLFTDKTIPASGILSSGSILLVAELNKATGEVRFGYQAENSVSVLQAGVLTLPTDYGPVLSGNQAMAVGLLADSGTSPSFAAAWDYLKVTSVRSDPAPQVSAVYTRLVSDQETYFQLDLQKLFGSAQSYQLVSVGDNSITASSALTGSTLQLGLLAGMVGNVRVQVRAIDQTMKARDVVFMLQVVPPPAPVLRINAGGSGYGTWSEDRFFTGGTLYSNAIPISDTREDYLFQTERFSDKLEYSIPLTSGMYQVKLRFAEIYHGVSNTQGKGARIFDVIMEQKLVLDNYDIIAAAGAPAAAVSALVDSVSVIDGFLNILFTAVVDKAKVSAIEILRYSLEFPPNTPPVVEHPGNRYYFEGAAVYLPVMASDLDPADSLNFTAVGLPSPLEIDASTGFITGSLEAPAGIYPVVISVDDNHGGVAQQSFTMEIIEPNRFHFRLNAGGAMQKFVNEEWLGDSYFVGGSLYALGAGIAGTSHPELYQTERYGAQFQYQIPVPGPARYEVTLHFAEKFLSGPGLRYFTIDLESGAAVRTGVDVFSLAGGGFRAWTEKMTTNVTDGELDINFKAQLNQAMVSAIEVVPCIEPATGQILLSANRICSGDSVTITINGVLNSARQWSLYSDESGDTSLASGISGVFVVKPTQSATYHIRPEGGCILPKEFRSVEIVVDRPAVISAASADKQILCPGETATIQINGILGSSTSWTLSKVNCGAVVDERSADGHFIVNPDATTTYQLSAEGGCAAQVPCVPVTVTRKSIAAGIEISGTELISSLDGSGYLWTDCAAETIISGESNKTFSPEYSGTFRVQVTAEGCQVTSDCKEMIVTDLPGERSTWSVFPNPADDFVRVKLPAGKSNGWLNLLDWSGRVVKRIRADQLEVQIDLNGIPAGIYLLRVEAVPSLRPIRLVH